MNSFIQANIGLISQLENENSANSISAQILNNQFCQEVPPILNFSTPSTSTFDDPIFIPDTPASDNNNRKEVNNIVIPETPNATYNVICPVCSKSFSASDIEEHADQCLEKQQSNRIIIDERIGSEDVVEETAREEEKEKFSIEMIKEKLCILLTQLQSELKDGLLCLIVFRGNVFQDFYSFFSRKGNILMSGCKYEFSYAGEPGVDDDGLSREFYNGIIAVLNLGQMF